MNCASNRFQALKKIELPRCISTNNEAIPYADKNTECCISTDYQTSGRGQDENSWHSEPGENILMTLVITPDFLAADAQFQLTQITSLAILTLLEALLPHAKVAIKWPNDIYIDEKKVAGVLIENRILGSHINSASIGIGLNVNQATFPIYLPNPISMFQVSGSSFNRTALIDQLLEQIAHFLEVAKEDANLLNSLYLNNLYLLEKRAFFNYKNEEIIATIKDTDHFGQLILKKEDGSLITVEQKEIQFLGEI